MKTKVKKRTAHAKKRASKPLAKKPKSARHPTAAEALKALEEIGRASVAAGTDKISDEVIEAEIRAYREGK